MIVALVEPPRWEPLIVPFSERPPPITVADTPLKCGHHCGCENYLGKIYVYFPAKPRRTAIRWWLTGTYTLFMNMHARITFRVQFLLVECELVVLFEFESSLKFHCML